MKKVLYKDLPRSHQYAIAYYMSVDCDAWKFAYEDWSKHPIWKKDCPTNEDREKYDAYIMKVMKRNIGFYIVRYGHKKFEMGEMGTEELCKRTIASGWPNRNVTTIDQYKAWVKENTIIPNHPLKYRWPVIMDRKGNPEDGWHRFHKYLLRGDKTVPVIYFT